MKITPQQLEHGIYQVGRTLLSPSPTYADSAMAASLVIQRERETQGKSLLDVWFECQSGSRKYYIIEKSDGSGEYKRALPSRVPEASIVKIVIPEDWRPASALLDQIEGLLKKFKQTTSFTDEPTNEVLELVGGTGAQSQLDRLLSLVDNIRSAADPAYNEQMMSLYLERFDSSTQSYTHLKDSPKVEQAVAMARKESEVLRRSLLSDCLLASFFLVFDDLCHAIHEHNITLGKPEQAFQGDYASQVSALKRTTSLHPLHLLGCVLGRALREGHHEQIANLGRQYFDKGRKFINEALDADTRHLHGAALYRAALVLFAAFQLFRALVKFPPNLNTSIEQLKKYANVAEENNVKVNDALLFALRDRGYELLEFHQRQIQNLAAQNGPNAAEAKVDELIEMKFYYPRNFRAHLKGI